MAENKKIKLFEDKKDCSGCCACMNICPKNAISMQEDEYGFIYPKIDYSRCVSCGACKQVCTYQKVKDLKYPQKVYAAAAKNTNILKKSASGGIFAVLAEAMIGNGGTVYGAAMLYENDKLVPKHIRINNKEDIIKLQGSKYVQSYTGTTFSEVKNDLENGMYVLYSGTPCQIAGLKGYLRKNYEKLLTVEVICHGVPNARFFQDYIKNIESDKNIEKVVGFDFRDKSKGQSKTVRLTMKTKRKKIISKLIDGGTISYVSLFFKSYTCRINCYSCPFAGRERIADITIGDYWGFSVEYPNIGNELKLSDKTGVSCVLINTEKGRAVLEACCNNVIIMESELGKAARHNDQLSFPSKYNSERELIMNLYKNKGYMAVESYYKKRYRLERIVKSIIWRMPKGLKRKIKQLVRSTK